MVDSSITHEHDARAEAVFKEASDLVNRTLPAGYEVEIHLRRMGDPSWHGISAFILQVSDPEEHPSD